MYSESLADQLRTLLRAVEGVTEKKMFGGLAFLMYGNVCCGVIGDAFMVRTGPDLYEAALQEPYTRPMDFTGRVLRNFVYVDPEAIPSDKTFHELVTRAVNYAFSLPRKTESPEDERFRY